MAWSEEKKQQALEAYALLGNLREVERETGVPRSIIHLWVKQNPDAFRELKDEYTEDFKVLAKAFVLEAAKEATRRLRDRKTSLYHIAMAIAIMIDKVRLLEGEPTEEHAALVRLIQEFQSK